MSTKKRVMSGIRATGPLHVGHYMGTVRNWLQLQQDYQCYFAIMDWHGMTSAYKKSDEVKGWVRDAFAEILAWGLDPGKHSIFVQSHVPEHLELFFVFANLTPMGWLERVPTWKDAQEEAVQTDTHNLGRFAYPVLQAADISIYRGEMVPVGQDQVAHVELCREIVRRFNRLYNGTLPEPRPLLTDTPSVPGLDGRKMSKSYNNTINLSEEPKALTKKVNQMITDPARAYRQNPGNPDICTVFTFHKLFSPEADQKWSAEGCRTAGIGCGDCKKKLNENIEKLIAGPRERKKELLNNAKLLDSIIDDGGAKARAEARKTMQQVKDWMKL